jgi:hypothetical protein
MESSIWSGWRFARDKLSLAATTPRSAALQSLSEPPNRPIGVRTAATRKTGFIQPKGFETFDTKLATI